jgi:hypothetical protein
MHRCAAFHRDADDTNFIRRGLDGAGNATDETAAGHRHDDRIEFGEIFEKLKPNCSLPRDHIWMVEGWDFGHALAGCQPRAFGFGLVLAVAEDAHFGAEVADGYDFILRHQPR